MTKDEVRNMMKYFQSAYKTFYEGSNLSEVLIAWYDAFKDVDKSEAQIAARNYVRSNEYPPTIAGVFKQLDLIRQPDSYTDLWALIAKAARNSTYGAAEEFDKLPPICRSFVGSAANLKDFGQIDQGTLQTVVKSQFVKAAPQIRERQNVQYSLPAEVRMAIENAKRKLLEGNYDDQLL